MGTFLQGSAASDGTRYPDATLPQLRSTRAAGTTDASLLQAGLWGVKQPWSGAVWGLQGAGCPPPAQPDVWAPALVPSHPWCTGVPLGPDIECGQG